MDLAHADVTIGTSAGATVAAQLTAATPAELLAAILATSVPASQAGSRRGRTTQNRVSEMLEATSAIIAASQDASDMRRRMGAASLERDPAPHDSRPTPWRDVVAARLPGARWPGRRVLITAVDARTGEPAVFDRGSEVDIVDAVAASTSVGFGAPPYRIGENRYLDGGYRRNENADLAAGCARVLVLSPFGGRSRYPDEWRMQLAAQVEELRAGGSAVETIFPDEASRAAFGPTMMELSTRPASARAGYEQGRALGAAIGEFWA